MGSRGTNLLQGSFQPACNVSATPMKGFFSTRGGMQVMTDYEFFAAEMKAREAEFTKKEKERKQRKEFHERP